MSTKAILPFILLMLASCNGGSGGASSGGGGNSTLSISSQFIDSPVKGLNISGSVSGNSKTGALGRFSCSPGEVITFLIRNLEIGKSTCGSEKVYLDDVVSSLDRKSDKVALILQSLSSTNIATEIDLSEIPEGHDISAQIDLSASLTVADLKSIINDIKSGMPDPTKFQPTVVSFESARAHVNSNLPPISDHKKLLFESLTAVPTVLVATGLESNDSSCVDFIRSKLIFSEASDGVYTAMLDEIVESDGAAYSEESCNAAGASVDCKLISDGILDKNPKIITGPNIIFESHRKNTWSILFSPWTDYGGMNFSAGSLFRKVYNAKGEFEKEGVDIPKEKLQYLADSTVYPYVIFETAKATIQYELGKGFYGIFETNEFDFLDKSALIEDRYVISKKMTNCKYTISQE